MSKSTNGVSELANTCDQRSLEYTKYVGKLIYKLLLYEIGASGKMIKKERIIQEPTLEK